ncbi:MAG: LON peptidase substrate-binding domain-containing protein, partial [Reyranella sp.]|nr:LON peptidase substrate-binding domain-containing protein [Reyranella sp.]
MTVPDDVNTAKAGAPPSDASAQSPVPPLPSDALIVLPTRNLVLFPELVFPLSIGRPATVAAAQQAVREQRQILVVLQHDPEKAEVGPDDLHRVGTVANIVRYVTAPDGTHHVICQGVQRFRISEFVEGHPFLLARGLHIVEPSGTDRGAGPEIEARFLVLQSQVRDVMDLLPQVPAELRQTFEATAAAGALADLAATYLDSKPAEKQEILETVELVPRLDKVSALLAQRLEVLRLSNEIGQSTKASLDARQREILLREQMAAIQRELGDEGSNKQELADLDKAITDARMPPEVEAAARKELRRLKRTPDAAAEFGMIRTYLDTLIELPWALPEAPPIDLAEARRVLDHDHFGLEKIKQRIVEYLAVRKLAPEGKAPILCFAGPPGVGKTSLGQSIARAMGRKFARVSLGGVHDEAEIRGHRRTYIGALPGNIVQAIRKAGSRDCVLMLDEIDKMGTGIHGDPSSAMLEVLDPEQNGTFRDNYLDVPFDLSRVVFIATANMLDTIPGPLRDRMEIISLTGYTAGEKLEIAKRYLVRRQLEANGLKPGQAEIDDAALQ